jgi:CheY-like chemotaxis protein
MEVLMSCRRILIIEDDYDIRVALKEILEWEGFQVLTAANGKEGLEVLEQHADPCLIILDIMMPIMNGWDFLKRFKTSGMSRRYPILIASASPEVGPRLRSEGLAFLPKPLDVDSLVNYVKAHSA